MLLCSLILSAFFETEINLTLCNFLFSGKFVPGCYTLAVSEALPEEMQVNIFYFYATSLRNLRRDLKTS